MLLEFYGLECSHCIKMHPLIERFEKETGIKVEKYETWHNEENARKQEEYDKGTCGGVPFFFNTEISQSICGEAPYEVLKAWGLGQPLPK